MTRVQALLIALSVAFAVVAGTYAAMQTTRLGTGATTHVSPTAVAHERRALRRTAVALHHALKQHPPKLPPVHRPARPAPKVVYVPGPSPVVTLPAAPVQPAAPARRRATPLPVTHVRIVRRRAPAPAGDAVAGQKPTGARGPAAAGTTPPPTTTTAVPLPPTTTTAPAVTTTHSSPAPSGGGDSSGDDNSGSDGSDDGGADD